jgi:hypothetical protein
VLASSTTWSHLHARSPCVFHEFRFAGVRPPELSIFATTPLNWHDFKVRTTERDLAAGTSADPRSQRNPNYLKWPFPHG